MLILFLFYVGICPGFFSVLFWMENTTNFLLMQGNNWLLLPRCPVKFEFQNRMNDALVKVCPPPLILHEIYLHWKMYLLFVRNSHLTYCQTYVYISFYIWQFWYAVLCPCTCAFRAYMCSCVCVQVPAHLCAHLCEGQSLISSFFHDSSSPYLF